ncbi:MAG: HesA/MoeB/ThiF family protein [Lentisphaeria bacterium]|jgi:molybdopterin/thiamine biosynthesis adenylyltransferase
MDAMGELGAAERERYARHLRLPQVGEAGQLRLKRGRVLVIGCGGLGSPALFQLAAAGVGTLGLVDADVVEASNLQRQILYGTADLGQPKAEQAARRLAALNPHLTFQPLRARFAAANAAELLAGWDFVLDCTDNFASKFQINDACVRHGIPFCHGGILAFTGQLLAVHPGRSACYRCVFGAPPPERPGDRLPAGPLGAVPGVIGTLQAMEAIKHLLGLGAPLAGRLLTYDALAARFREVPVARAADCPACGGGRRQGV